MNRTRTALAISIVTAATLLPATAALAGVSVIRPVVRVPVSIINPTPPSSVTTPTGQAFSVHGEAWNFIVDASGSGFASGGSIQIDLYSPTTGLSVPDIATVTASRTRFVLSRPSLVRTLIPGGKFNLKITVPANALHAVCQPDCSYTGAVQFRARQTSAPAVVTPWATTNASGTGLG